MSQIVTASPATLFLAPEVSALAQDLGVSAYLPGMAKVLQEVFWDAQVLAAAVEEDPEIADLRNILFTADGTWTKEEIRQRKQDWNDRTFAVCPAPFICTFSLFINRRPT